MAFLAGILVAFAMDALLQLNFSAPDYSPVVTCGYAITVAITVRLSQDCTGAGAAHQALS